MKLIGSKRNGSHVDKNGTKARPTEKKSGRKGGKRALKVASLTLLIIVALVTAAFAYIRAGVKPPPIIDNNPKDKSGNVTAPPTDGSTVAPPTSSSGDNKDLAPTKGRDPNKYTFIILGSDDGNGNTDVMMVATFDAKNYEFHVVNIPRDTLVNVSWNTKKANTIYANSKAGKPPEEQMDGVFEKMEDILGYRLDFYVVVDLKAFAALVDAIDGVDFYVPQDMNYEDPAQNLSIHLKKGQKHFNGADALKLVRFRGYNSADIGRIDMQQKFLTSAIQQILAKRDSFKSISKLTSLANIFIKYVKTDLELGEIIWLGQEFLKMDAENFTFTTLPVNAADEVYQGSQWVSYPTIYVDQWLELLNSKISPFGEDFVAEDLSILTRGANKKLYVTDGNYRGNSSWGSGSPSTYNNNNSSSNNTSNNNSNTTTPPSSNGSGENTQTPSAPPTTPSLEPPDNNTEPDPSTNPDPGVSNPPDTSSEPPVESVLPDNSGEEDVSGPVVG